MLVLKPNATKRILASSLRLYNRYHSSASDWAHHLLFSKPISTVESLLQSHTLIVTSGHSANVYIAAKLISLYASFDRPHFSTLLFNSILLKDTFLWNSIIKSHFSNGDYETSFAFYLEMRGSGVQPNHFTMPLVVSACAELLAAGIGRSIHGVSLKLNLLVDNSAVGSSFIYLYAKCGRMDFACRVFEEMPVRDVVAWTALVVGYVQNGESEMGLKYLEEMHRGAENERMMPNSRTIAGGLQACANVASLREGRCLHCYAMKTGMGSSSFVQSLLLSMYSKGGSIEEASFAFVELSDKDLVSWTEVVGVHVRNGHIVGSLELFQAMQDFGIIPDGIVISCLLSGFANFMSFKESKAFHGLIIKNNFESGDFVSNSLLTMYWKFESLDLAEKLFNRRLQRDSETWNCMISGYGKMGLEAECIQTFREMQLEGIKPDLNHLFMVISACSQLLALQQGRSIHGYIIKTFINEDISVVNSLVGMYGRCGNIDVALRIFYSMHRDVVTWNTLISAYAHNGQFGNALLLFEQMLSEDVKPNIATLLSALSACSNVAALNHGKRIHDYIKEAGIEIDASLGTALVDMYAKCGLLGISREIFDAMPVRDVITWNAMISGYGIHGNARDALETFRHLKDSCMKPNEVTFLAVLSACSHVGLVAEGKQIFAEMAEYSITPTLKHYACMVDLLGRSGNLNEAEAMISTIPFAPDGVVWGALLNACSIHQNVEMGELVGKRAFELEPQNDGYYIQTSNMYSSVGRWEEAERVRGMMNRRRVRKIAGWTAMEVGEVVHLFTAGDKSHPQSKAIYAMLEVLFKQMEECHYAIKGGFAATK